MAAYVVAKTRSGADWHGAKLIADTETELHQAAEKLGVVKTRFHEPPVTEVPLYILNRNQHKEAIKSEGFTVLTMPDFGVAYRRIREQVKNRGG